MNYRLEQDKFDKIKWYDSIAVGYDCCGDYDFCEKCNKSENYPCARAMERKDKKDKKRVRIAILRFKV